MVLLLSGQINAYRTSDHLLFATIVGKSILGLQRSGFRFDQYCFQPSKGSEIYGLPRDDAIILITCNGSSALYNLLDYQTYLNDFQSERAKLSAANYILARSNLAHSGVMKILTDMQKDNTSISRPGSWLPY